MRILLIEDDPEMGAMLSRVLRNAQFAVDLAQDGSTGLTKAQSRRYALVILDLMLPKVDGLQVCAELRAHRNAVPILMTTSRDSVSDRVRGLEVGADDYLPKPFDIREFLARVHALLRRDRTHRSRTLTVGTLELDTRQRTVTCEGNQVRLTRLEYEILEALVGNIGRTVYRSTLLGLIWQDDEPGSNKLDVAVRSLRRKLEGAGVSGLIEAVYGCGYRITSPERAASS